MILLRLGGAVMLVLFGGLCGEMQRQRIRQKLLILQQYRVFIDFLEHTIDFQKLPCPQLLQLAKQNEETFFALSLKNCQNLRDYRLPTLLSRTESETLNMIFPIIGTKQSTELHPFFEYSRNQCQIFETHVLKMHKQADELYTRIGLFLGATFAIFLF